MATRAAVIGLGIIGKGMARALLGASVPTAVYDLRREVVDEMAAQGAVAARSCREAAAAADVIGIVVRDDAEVREVALGRDGALSGAAPGSVIALHSTIFPDTVHEIARAAEPRGVGVLDAPVTGGQAGAENGTLCYIVGGDAGLLQRCRPVFEPPSATIVHAGPLGAGAALKLCNNVLGYLGFLAAFEADHLAERAGLSRDAFDAVTGASGYLSDQMRRYLAGRRADIDRTAEPFQARMRAVVDLAEKDLRLALELARRHDVELPGATTCRQLMRRVFGIADAE